MSEGETRSLTLRLEEAGIVVETHAGIHAIKQQTD